MVEAQCKCGREAGWWMTGSGITPHAACTTCKNYLTMNKGATAQSLSEFKHLPVVVSAETYSEGKAS